MNGLDRIMKARRKRIYKHLRKLFKARDMASKYLTKGFKVSKLDNHFSLVDTELNSTKAIALLIVDNQKGIRKGNY